MSQEYEHNPSDHEDPLPGPTWMIGFIGVVLLVVIVLGVTALYYGAADEEAQVKIAAVAPPELTGLRAEQLARLEGTYWEQRDDAGQAVRALVIPIDQAMQAVVSDFGAGGRP